MEHKQVLINAQVKQYLKVYAPGKFISVHDEDGGFVTKEVVEAKVHPDESDPRYSVVVVTYKDYDRTLFSEPNA